MVVLSKLHWLLLLVLLRLLHGNQLTIRGYSSVAEPDLSVLTVQWLTIVIYLRPTHICWVSYQVWVLVCRALMHVWISGQLRDGLRLSFTLSYDDGCKVLVARLLFILGFEHRRAIVAAGLVSQGFGLTLEQFGPTSLLLLIVSPFVCKHLGSILRRYDLLFLLRQYRSMIWCCWGSLNIAHLDDSWVRHLLLSRLNSSDCHNSTGLSIIETDNIIASVTIEFGCDLNWSPLWLLNLSHAWGSRPWYLHNKASWWRWVDVIFVGRFTFVPWHFKWHDETLRSFIFLLRLLLLDQLILN